MTKLLLIEDDVGFREQLRWAFAGQYKVFEASTLDSSVQLLKNNQFDIACVDMNLENIPLRGLDIIDNLTTLNTKVKIIVITANMSKNLGKTALEKGAHDYLTKPVDLAELRILLSRASRINRLEKSSYPIKKTKSDTNCFGLEFIGESDPMKVIKQKIKRIAKTGVSTLITGESGTGKELCARAIHFATYRTKKNFIPINCAAIPEHLLESELFGCVAGAFTGCRHDKIGLIEAANGGTLFLDEIGDMPRNLQVRILRFLDDHVIQRLGDTKFFKVDVRVVSATNKINFLHGKNGALRSDLYYRLAEFEIKLPPLRNRRNDIRLFIDKVIQENRVKYCIPKLRIDTEARDLLIGYKWPGNVRELIHTVNSASLTCSDQTISLHDIELPEMNRIVRRIPTSPRLSEKTLVLRALRLSNNKISPAAKTIGVSRPTFYNLLKKYNISP